MNRILNAIMIIIGIALASTTSSYAQGSDAFQWVGNTSVSVNHTVGHLAPYRQCQAEYNDSARVCTVLEVLNTVDSPVVSGSARLWRGLPQLGFDCDAWQLTSGSSFMVDENGVLNQIGGSCAIVNLRPFACCSVLQMVKPANLGQAP